jgi:SpoVK/Ycf46/Vps4 family AAA+-type ATPase
MKTIQKHLQTLSMTLRKFLIIFLAGVMILVTNACSRTQATTTYTDKSTPATRAKTERLVKEAEQNVKKSKSPQEVLDDATPDKSLTETAKDLDRSAKNAAKNVEKSAKKAVEDAPKKAEKGLKNIQENLEEAVDQAKDAAKANNNF